MNTTPTELRAYYHRLLADPDLAQRELAAEQLSRLQRALAPREQREAAPPGHGVDLVALVEATAGPVRRRPSGVAVAPCPWHSSRSGACLVVWPEGRWWCSSCRRGGDAVRWLALIEGIEYHHARRRLGLPRANHRREAGR